MVLNMNVVYNSFHSKVHCASLVEIGRVVLQKVLNVVKVFYYVLLSPLDKWRASIF